MPESKSGSNLRQVKYWQKAAARAEYLRHPDASISDVARATGVAVRTVARARETLVKEGLLAPGRNNAASAADAVALTMAAQGLSSVPGETESSDVPGEPREAVVAPKGTIDGEAFRQMNELLDQLADEDDDATRKRMLRQVKRFAFDPNLHPDTRMSASQLWAKLLDMQRSKDLGPGVPLTLGAAIVRATDFCRAAGPKVMVPAFYAAFNLGEVPSTEGDANARELPTDSGEAAPSSAGTTPAL